MSLNNPLGEDVGLATLAPTTTVVTCNQAFTELFASDPKGQTWGDLLQEALQSPGCGWVSAEDFCDANVRLFTDAAHNGMASMNCYVRTPSSMIYSAVITCAWDEERAHYFLRVLVYDELGPMTETSILTADAEGLLSGSLGLKFTVEEWETLREALSDPSITRTAERLGVTRKALDYRLREWAQRAGLKTPSELVRYLAEAYCRIGLRRGNTMGVHSEFINITAARCKNHPAHRLPDNHDIGARFNAAAARIGKED